MTQQIYLLSTLEQDKGDAYRIFDYIINAARNRLVLFFRLRILLRPLHEIIR